MNPNAVRGSNLQKVLPIQNAEARKGCNHVLAVHEDVEVTVNGRKRTKTITYGLACTVDHRYKHLRKNVHKAGKLVWE